MLAIQAISVKNVVNNIITNDKLSSPKDKEIQRASSQSSPKNFNDSEKFMPSAWLNPIKNNKEYKNIIAEKVFAKRLINTECTEKIGVKNKQQNTNGKNINIFNDIKLIIAPL